MKTAKEIKAEIDRLAKQPDDTIDLSDIPEQVDWSGAVRGKFYRPQNEAVMPANGQPAQTARTGETCPESGIWVAVGQSDVAIAVAVGNRMPPLNGHAVTWQWRQAA